MKLMRIRNPVSGSTYPPCLRLAGKTGEAGVPEQLVVALSQHSFKPDHRDHIYFILVLRIHCMGIRILIHNTAMKVISVGNICNKYHPTKPLVKGSRKKFDRGNFMSMIPQKLFCGSGPGSESN
jgi:hypothetical protein